MDEQEAVTRLKNGDISGLEILVEKYCTRAVRAAYLIMHEHEMAEDIVQSAFLRTYERIEQFDARRPFWPWFLRSVINDAVKAASRHRSIPLDDSQDIIEAAHLSSTSTDDPEALAEFADIQQAIQSALFQLSPFQRVAIVLRYFLEMDGEEMAIAMNCPPATARCRLPQASLFCRVIECPASRARDTSSCARRLRDGTSGRRGGSEGIILL